jgi:hypothetical protein
MLNFVANSKSRVAARAEKKMEYQRQHELMREQTSREQHNLDRKLELEMQRLDAARPKGLLGAAAKHKTDHSKFEFEDDTGEQRALNDEYDVLITDITEEARKLRRKAEIQGFILKDQVEQVGRMTDKVSGSLIMVTLAGDDGLLTWFPGSSCGRRDHEATGAPRYHVQQEVIPSLGGPVTKRFPVICWNGFLQGGSVALCGMCRFSRSYVWHSGASFLLLVVKSNPSMCPCSISWLQTKPLSTYVNR